MAATIAAEVTMVEAEAIDFREWRSFPSGKLRPTWQFFCQEKLFCEAKSAPGVRPGADQAERSGNGQVKKSFPSGKLRPTWQKRENAIEKCFAQAFSFDFDGVETSLAGWAASALKNADKSPKGLGEGLPKAEPNRNRVSKRS